MATIDTSIARVTPGTTPTATGTTASFTPAVGDLLIAAGCFDNSGTAATVTDTAGGTWVSRAFSDGGADAPTSSSTSAVFTCLVTTSSARTVTMACSGAFFQSFKVYRVTPGAGGSMSVGATGHAGNASANMTPTAFTSTVTGSTMFVASACLLATTAASSSDLTADVAFNSGLDDLAPLSGFKTLGAAGSQTFNCSATTTGPWHWGAIEVIETISSSPGGELSYISAPPGAGLAPVATQALGLPTFRDPFSLGAGNDSIVPPPPNPDAVALFGRSTPRRRLHWPPRRRPIPPVVPIPSRDLTPPLRVAGASQSVTSAGATKTIPIPAGCLTGEQLLAFQVQDELGLLANMTAPAGWNLVNSATFGAGQCMKVWEKGVTATEPAYTTWGMTTAATGRVSIVRIIGRKLFGALGLTAYINGGAGSPTTHTTPAFYSSSTDGDVLIVAEWASIAGVSNTWTLPATYTAIGALTDNLHLSNAMGWWGSAQPRSAGAEFFAGQAATTTIGGGDISCAVTISQWLWMPQLMPGRHPTPTPRQMPARRRQVTPVPAQATPAPSTFVPVMPPRRVLAWILRRPRIWPGPADDDLQDLSPSVTTRRRVGRAMARAIRRRGDFDPPFPQAAPVAPTFVPASPPRRRLAALVRRRFVAGPADDDLQDLPTLGSPAGRRRPALVRRRTSVASPVPSQAAPVAPAYPPAPTLGRRVGRLLRRPGVATVVPAQAAPVAPTWVPQRATVRRVLAGLRVRRGGPLPADQLLAPARPTRRGRPVRAVRPSTVTPPQTQAAPITPGYPPAPTGPRRWGRLLRRARAAAPVPTQVTLIAPPYPPAGVSPRRLGRILRRPGSVGPVPAQQAAPAAPAYVPGRSLPRRVAAFVRRQRGDTAPPVDQAAAPTSTVRRARAGWRRPARTVGPVPAQTAPVAPTWVPGIIGARRLARLARRGRATSPTLTQAAPVAPAWVPLVPVLRRLGRPRRGRAVAPVPPQIPVAPGFVPAPPDVRGLRGLWRRRSATVTPTPTQDRPGRTAPQRHPTAMPSRTHRGAMPPIPQAAPPAAPDVRRLGPFRVRRGKVAQPARPQDVVPAYPTRPSSPRRVLASVRGLRRVTPRWVGVGLPAGIRAPRMFAAFRSAPNVDSGPTTSTGITAGAKAAANLDGGNTVGGQITTGTKATPTLNAGDDTTSS